MTRRTFRVGPDSGAGERLDVFLSRRIPDFARSQFQRFIDKGFVFVNGERKKPSLKLRATLTSPGAGATPALLEWSVSWTVIEHKVYLPVVVK